jgi:hypothetical protein
LIGCTTAAAEVSSCPNPLPASAEIKITGVKKYFIKTPMLNIRLNF